MDTQDLGNSSAQNTTGTSGNTTFSLSVSFVTIEYFRSEATGRRQGR